MAESERLQNRSLAGFWLLLWTFEWVSKSQIGNSCCEMNKILNTIYIHITYWPNGAFSFLTNSTLEKSFSLVSKILLYKQWCKNIQLSE